jgi:hypothetical protein
MLRFKTPNTRGKGGEMTSSAKRLNIEVSVRVERFEPWWLKCEKCSKIAKMWPRWAERVGDCKCQFCGALYTISMPQGQFARVVKTLPLWFKSGFRNQVFWALNEKHLAYLEQVISAGLRERAVFSGRRIRQNQAMPFVLPAWLLSAKNRPDLLHLIARLKKAAVS